MTKLGSLIISLISGIISGIISLTLVNTNALAANTSSDTSAPASTRTTESVDKSKIEFYVRQGVPRESLKRILLYLRDNNGRTINVDAYSCSGLPTASEAACHHSKRANLTRAISIQKHRYAAIVDFSLPSTERRFFLIDLQQGKVEKYYVAHGKGSGIGRYATAFSNKNNSHSSSLGLYVTGGTYVGRHGRSLRLYGLEKSNSNSYDRDIVIHGAPYASENFIKFINRKTGQRNNRLGLSYGCPALPPNVAQKIISKLIGGAILDVYHPTLTTKASTGAEVTATDVKDDTETAPVSTGVDGDESGSED
jgi:hypothetical protein